MQYLRGRISQLLFTAKAQGIGHGTTSRTPNVNVILDAFKGDYDNQDLRQDQALRHFSLDSDFVRGRQHVFIFASTNVTGNFLREKIQQVFESLHCAANKYDESTKSRLQFV